MSRQTKFLANIREVDAIAEVVRAFNDPNVSHVHGQVDAATDVGVINAELVIADLDAVVSRLKATKKKFHTDPDAREQLPLLERLATALQQGTLVSNLSFSDEERLVVREFNLLTAKPFIYIVNVSEGQLAEGWQPPADLLQAIGDSPWVMMSNKVELDLSEVSKEEKAELLRDLELPESGLDRLITTAYEALGLISFLTTGEKESRAWTCTRGSIIPIAARAIHTDFERLFIRAQVIAYDDLIAAGSLAKARETGKLRTEGRDYIVQDGDVVEILIGQ